MAPSEVPKTHRALQFTSSTLPPTIIDALTPPVTAGTVLVQPLRASVVSYIADIFTRGNPRGYHYPLPIVPGSTAIGRIIAAATDVPSLQPGSLVWLDPVLRARDGSTKILHGLNGPPDASTKAFMEGEWRDGSWAEVVKVPAENAHLLNEQALLGACGEGGLGYGLDNLGYISTLAVAYGGMRDVDVRAGETVLVAPATGSFGGAAVHVALALGANVVALGRNASVLADLAAVARRSYPLSRLATVRMAPGMDEGALQSAISSAAAGLGSRQGAVDVYFDMSPPSASRSPHITAGILALRPGGRASLMGGAAGAVGIPYFQVMRKGLRLQGTFMYTSEQAGEAIRLVETGRLKLGSAAGLTCAGVFALDEWEKAFEAAEAEGRAGSYVLLAPSGKDTK
ncbi:alcohol dehydrogenase GroES domain-containing protein [Thozetella sp. PMI_491]|nr:alcohol dehydrogenase GroES domain-containing protein [Thozetella sp. PMI_491]